MRELRKCLPEHIDSWIDENRLLIGDDVQDSLEHAISTDTDFVVLFVDALAAKSAWVRREVEWALTAEQRLGRVFLLPVVLDADAWETFEPLALRKRKFLACNDFTESGIRHLADEISNSLFAWLSRDVERAKAATEPAEQSDVLGDADKFLRSVASEIRTIVHPHRRENPLDIDALYARLSSLNQVVGDLSPDQFSALLTRLDQQNLLSGLNFDGDEIFVEEENYAWKVESFTEAKRRISRLAAKRVQTGDVVALDAGSTTEAIARQISKLVRLRRLKDLTVVTNSLPAASALLAAGNDIGLEDGNDVLRVYLAGGRVRPNTLAIVSLDDDAGSDLRRYLDTLGGASIAFVGTNGIRDGSFTTEVLAEAQTKRALLEHAAQKFVVTDPSKFGLVQKHAFASYEGVNILTSAEGYEDLLESVTPDVAARGGMVTLA
jgi:DeoR/GlpR family transcriptional regulator of sugar metabolism